MALEKLTPMMRQYKDLKERYRDAILFFRLGDFYEMFFEDAVMVSRLLNLTLTKRQTAPMCGIPFHAADSYLGRLTRLGKKVAICEQLSDPNLPGIVERDVIRVVTPGTTFDERILEQKSNRFIISVAFRPSLSEATKLMSPKGATFSGEKIGLAVCDLTTGLFQVASLKNLEELRDEIFRLHPAECVVDATEKTLPDVLKNFEKLPVFPHQFWEEPREYLAKHFGVKNLECYGIENCEEIIFAAGLLLNYLKETQKSDLAHLRPPQILNRNDEMILDETAIRNLELIESMREGKREGSLLAVIDATKTSMGGRTLRNWLIHPLHNKTEIERRLSAVSEIKNDFAEIFASVLDIERLLSKLSVGHGNARDMLGIGISLRAIEPTQELLKNAKSEVLKNLKEGLENLGELKKLREKILNSIVENPALSIKDGGIIRDGINKELDELRKIASVGKGFLQKLQEKEIARTGINSLKVRFNQVFGYYIEITKANLHLAPADYIRKQTLVNAERFITPELKEYEEKILGAEAKMKELEYNIFLQMRLELQEHTREIQEAAQIFGTLDALHSLKIIAEKNRYTRPEIGEENSELIIKNGRHPVVEALAGGKFVPNDVELGFTLHASRSTQIILLTGPNMGGKSTYLRQTALIVLLAHIGSFVPADSAKIPLTDRIFTRVGASDNLVRGQSTFMVEMQEASQILHYATKNSLIILDEIGRGTSTYDGVSLAWAILEYIHDVVGAKTLFATHYHELIAVAEKLKNAANFSVAVKEAISASASAAKEKEIIFLYKVIAGAINRSYGIEVARLAGLPKEIIAKAKTILNDLEEGVHDQAIQTAVKRQARDENQLDMFTAPPREHRAIAELKEIDINEITPLEALQKIDEWKKEL